MADSIMQTEKACFITGSTTQLCRHHIYASGRRKASEKYEAAFAKIGYAIRKKEE